VNLAMQKPFVFVLIPFSEGFDDIYQFGIKPACADAGAYCERVDEQIFTETIMERIYNQIAKADIIVAEMTGRNPNVFYETGYAHALNKPVVLLTQHAEDIPFDLKQYPHIIYSGKIVVLKQHLESRIRWLIENSIHETVAMRPRHMQPKEQGSQELLSTNSSSKMNISQNNTVVRNEVFISYSHKDIKWLQRLQVHLKPLERLGKIRRWDDTLISPGFEWREEIRKAVASAKVAVLLISADFLASEFIHTNELPPLLAAAEAEGTKVLPVIVSPSRFEKIKNLSQFQAVNSPSQPLIKMNRNQQEELLVRVTEAIETALHD
jgi:nucleoside 2-deoxyribosyltransferase